MAIGTYGPSTHALAITMPACNKRVLVFFTKLFVYYLVLSASVSSSQAVTTGVAYTSSIDF